MSSSSPASWEAVKDGMRDVFVWKRKKLNTVVVLVSTVIWVFMEIYGFSFVTIFSSGALLLLASLFLWANLLRLFSKDPPGLSSLEVSEKASINAANFTRTIIEEGIKWVFKIATQQQILTSIRAILGLWLLSFIGAQIDFPTLLYTGTLLGLTVPGIWLRYEENLRRHGERLRIEGRKLYEMIDEKVIKKIESKFVDVDKVQIKEKKLQ